MSVHFFACFFFGHRESRCVGESKSETINTSSVTSNIPNRLTATWSLEEARNFETGMHIFFEGLQSKIHSVHLCASKVEGGEQGILSILSKLLWKIPNESSKNSKRKGRECWFGTWHDREAADKSTKTSQTDTLRLSFSNLSDCNFRLTFDLHRRFPGSRGKFCRRHEDVFFQFFFFQWLLSVWTCFQKCNVLSLFSFFLFFFVFFFAGDLPSWRQQHVPVIWPVI